MLEINTSKDQHSFDYNGIKIFYHTNPTKLIKDLFLSNDVSIRINNIYYKKENIIYINELTKFSAFVELSKSSNINKIIIELLKDFPIINEKNVLQIVKHINKDFAKMDLISNTSGDLNKIIALFFELLDENYINLVQFEFVLKKILNNKNYLFIFDNVSWINICKLEKFVSKQNNFILVTNNFLNFINNKKELELLIIFNNKYDSFELLDINQISNYLELKVNQLINEDNIISVLKTNDLKASQCLFYLMNIVNNI